jgi:chromate transporter
VYWPEAFTSGGTPLDFSWGTLVLAIAAAVALFRYKRGILEVLAVSVLIGAILYGLGVR